MTDRDDLKRLSDAAGDLIEHFDAVLILASGRSADGGGTVYFREARGNCHANEGLAREYIRRLEAYEHGYHAEAGRSDAFKDRQPPEGDEWKGPEDGE